MQRTTAIVRALASSIEEIDQRTGQATKSTERVRTGALKGIESAAVTADRLVWGNLDAAGITSDAP